MKEEWRVIKDFPDYAVSNMGRVKRTVPDRLNRYPAGRTLKQRTNQNGYRCLVLYKNGKKVDWRIHQLVAHAFLDNPNGLKSINHIDGVKTNNCASNLEFCSSYENMQHAKNNGLLRPSCGETNKLSKLTNDDVTEIKNHLLEGKLANKEIARMYGVRESMISRIKRGQRWKHHTHEGFKIFNGPSHKGESAGGVKLKNGEVWLIKKLLSHGGFTQKFIGQMFGVKQSAIQNIKAGNTWTHIQYP